MRILLDSNAYSQLMRGHDRVAELVRNAREVLLSAVAVGELMYGFRQGSRFKRNVAQLRSFLDSPYVSFVPVGPVTADRYSRIATLLRAKGRPIPTNDMWTAAHALIPEIKIKATAPILSALSRPSKRSSPKIESQGRRKPSLPVRVGTGAP